MAFSTDQITVTGTGSLSIPSMPSASSLTNIVVYDSSSGQFSYTSSAAVGGGTSGTYTPSFRGLTGITDLTLGSGVATYFQIGNLVQGNFRFRGEVTNSISAQFFFTLPIEPATFSNNRRLNSTFGIYSQPADIQDFQVVSVSGDVVAEVNIYPLATHTFESTITFNYLVA